MEVLLIDVHIKSNINSGIKRENMMSVSSGKDHYISELRGIFQKPLASKKVIYSLLSDKKPNTHYPYNGQQIGFGTRC